MAKKKEQEIKKVNEKKKGEAKIEKVVLSVAGTAEKLDKGVRLLKVITGMEPKRMTSTKRIPSLGVRPGLETGAKVTLRRARIGPILARLLKSVNNEIEERQVTSNHFSFGIHEYIEIPGMEYQRDIGILGLNVTVDFARPGKRIARKKIKSGRVPRRQDVTKEEIIEYMSKNYGLKLKEK
jgi:large subunit ribosomal protein L5